MSSTFWRNALAHRRSWLGLVQRVPILDESRFFAYLLCGCAAAAHSSDQKQGSDVISRLAVTFCRVERVFCVLIRVVSNTVNIASCSHLLVLQLLAALHEVAPATMSKHSSSETERWPATSCGVVGVVIRNADLSSRIGFHSTSC